MLGYKVYYDKAEKKFKYETEKSEVQSTDQDDTFWWSADTDSASYDCDYHNNRLDEVLVCKDCGAAYFLTRDEKDWFNSRGLVAPKRCCRCRRARKTGGAA